MSHDFMFVDIKAHGVFYAACQAALYVFAFRHEEMVTNKKHLAFLRYVPTAVLLIHLHIMFKNKFN